MIEIRLEAHPTEYAEHDVGTFRTRRYCEQQLYKSKAFAQELLRARVDEYSPDNSLPWEGREEDYYPNPDDEYTEEEVQAHIRLGIGNLGIKDPVIAKFKNLK